ncbi:MAG: sulfatase/phosphatase domain-containing protein, partial [Planctomycetota bacterium]
RDPLTFHYPHWAFHRANRPGSAIREGQYKLIHRYDDDSVELYDLEADLGETNNLAENMPERASALKAALRARLDELGAARPTPLR